MRERLVVTAGPRRPRCARKRNVEMRLHEMNFDWGREPGTFGRLYRRFLWRLPRR